MIRVRVVRIVTLLGPVALARVGHVRGGLLVLVGVALPHRTHEGVSGLACRIRLIRITFSLFSRLSFFLSISWRSGLGIKSKDSWFRHCSINGSVLQTFSHNVDEALNDV